MKRLAVKTDTFLQGLVDEHRKGVPNKEGEETMISCLLLLQKSDPEYYTDETIKGLILVSGLLHFYPTLNIFLVGLEL